MRVPTLSGDVASFTEDSIITTDGRTLGPFDVVVAATGYEKVGFFCISSMLNDPALNHGGNRGCVYIVCALQFPAPASKFKSCQSITTDTFVEFHL